MDTLLPFDLPAIARKKVSATFDGGRITSDGGVMLVAEAERRLGIADQLAAVVPTSAMPTGSPVYCPTSCAPASSPSPAAAPVANVRSRRVKAGSRRWLTHKG